MPNLAGVARAWADLRRAGMSAKTFADLLSIDPEIGSHIDAARAAGHDDLTIVNNLGGVLPSQPDPQAKLMMKLSRISELPDDQRSFARFELLSDHAAQSNGEPYIQHAIDRHDDRRANLGENDRWDGTSNDLLMQIGNPENPKLRRAWEEANGRRWPRDPITGRNFDVAHIKALADGGKNELSNIRPMHPLEHRLEHMRGDFARWAKRAGIAKAFGGTVLPFGAPTGKITPPPGPFYTRGSVVNGLGWLSLVPNITGVLSGRIRTDSLDNFASDVMGYESQQDEQRRQEDFRKMYCPDTQPGTLCV